VRRVALHPFSSVNRVRAGSTTLLNTLTGEHSELETDLVAIQAGYISDDDLAGQLADDPVPVRTIGDCVSPRRLSQANWEADRTVLELIRSDVEPRRAARAW